MTGGNNKSRKRPRTGDSGGDNLSNKHRAVSTPVADNSIVTVAETPETAVRKEWREKLDMSPPLRKIVPAGGTVERGATMTMMMDAPLMEVEKKMKEDGWGEYLVGEGASTTDEQKIVYFLYGTDFYKDETTCNRVGEIQKFLQGDAKKRMMDLLKKDSNMSHCPDNVELWRKVQGVILRYRAQQGAFTIFDGKNMPVAMRTQATKNCYQHATGGTVGYKIAWAKGDNAHTVHTLDVAKTVRHHYDDDKLKQRVLQNKDGKSQKLLKKMISGMGLEVGNSFVSKGLGYAFSEVKESGPALISRFCTDDYFKQNGGLGRANGAGTFRIHQFDRVNDQDTCIFLELGPASPAEKDTLETMESKNRNSERGAAPTSPIVHAVSQSSSAESHEDDTETESVLEGAGGLHAMILIGGREDTSGNKWFLIQNTWKSLPVFEASQSYLARHLNQRKGKVVFLEGALQENFLLPLMNQGLCLESNDCDDVAEVDDDDEEDEEDEEWDTDDLEE